MFDSIKVSPPIYLKDIDDSIAKLNEKKEYFIKSSDEQNEKNPQEKNTEEKQEGKEEEGEGENKKKDEEAEKVENEEAKKAKTKKEKIDLDNEEMFPTIG